MIGIYVKYNNLPYIVVGMSDCAYKLNAPEAKRVQVKHSSCTPMKCNPAKAITYKGNDYLVTAGKHIFSLTSGKLMKWMENNGDRKAIMNLASNPF